MSPRIRGLSILSVLLCAVQLYGDTKQVTLPPGWVILDPEAPAGADVSWEARQPITLDYREFVLPDTGRRVCVLYLAAGKYVIVSDIIDWDAKRRKKTTWIVTVGKPGPAPDPDDPDPDVQPISALTRQVRDLAKQVKLARSYATLMAVVFEDVASQIAAGGITTPDEAIRVLVERLPPLHESQKKLTDAISEYLNTRIGDDVRKAGSAFREIAAGLRLL